MRAVGWVLCLSMVGAAPADEVGLVSGEPPEDPEIGYYGANDTLLVADIEEMGFAEGRMLAETKKPKRKYCNTSAYGLKGDYAYEACGSFCKQAKAINHCKFCKCRACTFCAAEIAKLDDARTKLKEAKKVKKTAVASGAAGAAKEDAKKAKKALKGLKKAGGKGKGKGKKRKLKMVEKAV